MEVGNYKKKTNKMIFNNRKYFPANPSSQKQQTSVRKEWSWYDTNNIIATVKLTELLGNWFGSWKTKMPLPKWQSPLPTGTLNDHINDLGLKGVRTLGIVYKVSRVYPY